MVDILKKVKQETGSYCGPAVIEMLVGHFGKDVSQEQVVEASGSKETVMRLGIPLIELAKGVRKLFPDLQVWEKQNSQIEDIDILVNKGYPVAVDWQGIFTSDEYGDEIWNTKNKIETWWKKIKNEPEAVGDQGHYCIAVEIDRKKGFLKFVDPYGHYAGKERFVAIWEFEERWWDDRMDVDEKGKKKVVLEEKLMFLITNSMDTFPGTLGMKKV